jgi:hypothetical protein
VTALAASLWGSDLGRALVLFAIFDAAFVIGIMLFGGGARKRRERSLAKRLGFRRDVNEPHKQAGSHWVPSQLVAAGQRFAVATGFSA